ncbi:MAG TPA: sugar ABC transporter substrate-binding protein [Spirochaetia bacterium]|nr:sugar ABC transporter substrate-binding protein [Spirochaetia bacterium]
MSFRRILLSCVLISAGIVLIAGSAFGRGQGESSSTGSAAVAQIKIATDSSGFSEPVWPQYTKSASLTVWTWITNADKLGAMFQKAFPTIQMDVKSVGQGQTDYTKLATAIQAGSGAPDVAQVEFQALPQFVNTGGLLDISPYVAGVKPLFPEWAWNQVSMNGKLYAIPQDAGPEGLIYRKDLFDQYKIAVPKTWAEFEQAGAALHQADPSKYITFVAVNDEGEVMGLLWQGGAYPFKNTPNGWKIDFTSAAAKKVMSYWLGLVQKGYVKVANAWTPDWSHELAVGTYGAVIGAAWSPTYEIEPYMEKNTTQAWRVSEMPQWNAGDTVDSNWGGSTDAVTTQTKYPDAAALFAAWLNTNKDAVALESTDIGQGGSGLFSADLFANKLPNFSAPVPFLGGQSANAVFTKMMPWVDKSFEWSPWTSYVYNQMQVQFSDMFNGKISSDQALQNIQDSVVSFARAQGFKVAN